MTGSETADRRIEEPRAATKPDLTFHWVILLIALAVLMAALVLRVRGGQQVVIPVVDFPLPGVCTYKRLVGRECPGCGLTRCFISLAHGELARAWAFNPAGIFLFVMVFLQLPYRAIQLWRVRQGLREIRLRHLSNLTLWLMVAGLFLQWVVRILIPQMQNGM